MTKKKIGIFGGTFDPVHIGHVATLVALAEAHSLDHVYIIPVNINPQKGTSPTASAHRLQMLKEAFSQVPRCSILTLEIEKAGPSYTIDTVRELQREHILLPTDSLFLLLGQDVLRELTRWKEVHELVRIARPIIAQRAGTSLDGAWSQDPELKSLIESGFTHTPLMDVSATDIRQRLKKGLFCGHLLDKDVLTYIQKHQLYHE